MTATNRPTTDQEQAAATPDTAPETVRTPASGDGRRSGTRTGTKGETVREIRPGADRTFKIVGLGDSLTFGYEPHVTRTSDIYGFADRLYEQALFRGRAELHNFAIYGLTTDGLKRLTEGALHNIRLKARDLQDFSLIAHPQAVEWADELAAQTPAIREAMANAHLVVITIGSNDFSDLLRDALQRPAQERLATIRQGFPPLLEPFVRDAEAMLRTVRLLAPNALIRIADLYQPVPARRFGMTAKLHAALNRMLEQISGELEKLAVKLRREEANLEGGARGGTVQGKRSGVYALFPAQSRRPSER